MEEICLSVIIPVYNTGKYLTRLFQSAETAPDKDMEWIFVDDGSMDDSIQRIEGFQKQRANVFLLKQSHKGAPVARNRGVAQARGQYIYFFDSDDYFEEGIFFKIIYILKEEKPDILIGNGFVVDEQYHKTGEKFQGIVDKTIQSNQELFFVDSNPGNKIFSKAIIEKNQIRFDDVSIHQDLNFYLKYIPYCQKIRYISDFMYYYLVRTDSIAHKVDGRIIEVINAMDGIYRYYQERNWIQKYEKELEYNYIKHLCFQIEKIPFIEPFSEQQKVALGFIKVLKTMDYKNNEFIKQEKIDLVDDLLAKEKVFLEGDYQALFAEREKKYKIQEERLNLYNRVLTQWLSQKIQKKKEFSYFHENHIKKIAIYGTGTLGTLFYEDLKDTGIEVAYFIDQRAGESCFKNDKIEIIHSDAIESMGKVDAIVVTPVHVYESIYNNLKKMEIKIPIVSLEDIITSI